MACRGLSRILPGVLCLGAIATLSSCSPSTKLVTFVPRSRDFAIVVPVALAERSRYQLDLMGLPGDGDGVVETYTASQGKVTYMVGRYTWQKGVSARPFNGYPADYVDPKMTVIDRMMEQMAQQYKGRIQSAINYGVPAQGNAEEVPKRGVVGKDFVADVKLPGGGAGQMSSRIIGTNIDLYQMVLVYPKGKIKQVEIDRFFDSLRIAE
jgi:hypothetical protein